MAYENIQVSREGPVATITVNRPKALNALNSATLRELLQAVREAAESSRALILTGAGDKAFVAGADIAEMAPMTPWSAREFSELGHVLTAMLEDIPCATIAAVNGYALGGGLELAVACEKRLVERGYDIPLRAANRQEAETFALLFDTQDRAEGMRAFLEKRPARFVGK